MLFSTSCKQGKLQLTEDGFLQVVSLFGGQPAWREAVQSIRAVDMKPGAMASCGMIVHATQDHLVTMIVRKDFDQLCQFIPAPVNQVAELVIAPPPAPAPVQPAPPAYPQPVQPQVFQPPQYQPAPVSQPAPYQPMPMQPAPPQAYPQPATQPAPAAPPQMETTVKSYKKAKDYQHDLKRMQRQGWTVQNALDHFQDRSLAYKLLVPGGILSNGKGEIVVTYQRPKKR